MSIGLPQNHTILWLALLLRIPKVCVCVCICVYIYIYIVSLATQQCCTSALLCSRAPTTRCYGNNNTQQYTYISPSVGLKRLSGLGFRKKSPPSFPILCCFFQLLIPIFLSTWATLSTYLSLGLPALRVP
jgi:hypothetical protein